MCKIFAKIKLVDWLLSLHAKLYTIFSNRKESTQKFVSHFEKIYTNSIKTVKNTKSPNEKGERERENLLKSQTLLKNVVKLVIKCRGNVREKDTSKNEVM